MRRRDKRYIDSIPLILFVATVALYLMWGFMELIGSEWTMLLGIVAFGLMVFFSIVLPLIDRLIIFWGMKLIEKQNKEKL